MSFEENNNIDDASDFVNNSDPAIIKVIGVGGGGCNAVNYMYRQDIPNVTFAVINTDKQALRDSPVPTKLVIGWDITKGNGAGNRPDVGRQCAEADTDKISRLFDDDTEMVFITAGMGGGTGTGAAPIVAQLAKEAGLLTIGIVTVPFLFEGEKKILQALEGADQMRKNVDALLVINNQNLIEIYKDLDFFNAFGKADDTLANAARSISEIISENCYINVDFQDVRTTLTDSGTAIISTGYGEGEHRISEAIHNALHSPLLKAHDIQTSQRILIKICCMRYSEKPLRAEEFNELTDFMAKLPKTVAVKWGIADDPSLGEKVKITMLASGFDVTLRDDPDGGKKITWEGERSKPKETKAGSQDTTKILEEVYGKENINKKKRSEAKVKYVVLTPEQFDDEEVIAQLERTPSFNRDPKFAQHLRQKEERETPAGRDRDRGDNVIMFGSPK